MKHKTKHYCIDLDGVTFDFTSAFRAFVEQHTGQKIDMRKVTDYWWSNVVDSFDVPIWRSDNPDEKTLIDLFTEARGFRKLKPYKEAIWAINHLNNIGHKVSFVTGRHEGHEDCTKDSLEKHFSHIDYELYWVGNKEYNDEKSTKSEICNDIDGDILIEDCAYYINEVAENCPTLTPYLIRKSYNRYADTHERVEYVDSWREILELEEEGMMTRIK